MLFFIGGTAAQAHFRLPFDSFFLDETMAPRVEAAYRKHVSPRHQTGLPSYVLVRVKGRRDVIEDLHIKDKPIGDFLTEEVATRSDSKGQ